MDKQIKAELARAVTERLQKADATVDVSATAAAHVQQIEEAAEEAVRKGVTAESFIQATTELLVSSSGGE